MSSRDMADGVNHGKYDQAENKADSQTGDLAPCDLIHDHGAGPGRNDAKGSERFGQIARMSESLHAEATSD